MSALIEFDEVCKYYQMGDTTVKAADHITMKIEKGEFVAIVGQSGSGKSTCMNIIGCLLFLPGGKKEPAENLPAPSPGYRGTSCHPAASYYIWVCAL